MTSRVLISPAAWRDLDELTDYLEQESEEVADRFNDAVEETLNQLKEMPLIGVERTFSNSRLAGTRMWFVTDFKKVFVFYRPVTGGIEVIRFLHSTRNVLSILENME